MEQSVQTKVLDSVRVNIVDRVIKWHLWHKKQAKAAQVQRSSGRCGAGGSADVGVEEAAAASAACCVWSLLSQVHAAVRRTSHVCAVVVVQSVCRSVLIAPPPRRSESAVCPPHSTAQRYSYFFHF